jgi:hypothetical protein
MVLSLKYIYSQMRKYALPWTPLFSKKKEESAITGELDKMNALDLHDRTAGWGDLIASEYRKPTLLAGS